eukprot:TRINITY_DN11530_c1_g1_i1.p2 TRINITY_DN11530_c1_g1~~TRINITY_DN11530_c1_g1_i1.p2  ORF type:complete len:179 (+),score=45.26 TRINITY_DN11530_c1_g1_i1:120-656(+)
MALHLLIDCGEESDGEGDFARERLRNGGFLRSVPVDGDTDVPLDLYLELMRAAEHARGSGRARARVRYPETGPGGPAPACVRVPEAPVEVAVDASAGGEEEEEDFQVVVEPRDIFDTQSGAHVVVQVDPEGPYGSPKARRRLRSWEAWAAPLLFGAAPLQRRCVGVRREAGYCKVRCV